MRKTMVVLKSWWVIWTRVLITLIKTSRLFGKTTISRSYSKDSTLPFSKTMNLHRSALCAQVSTLFNSIKVMMSWLITSLWEMRSRAIQGAFLMILYRWLDLMETLWTVSVLITLVIKRLWPWNYQKYHLCFQLEPQSENRLWRSLFIQSVNWHNSTTTLLK